jgi:hypothetical protein
LKQDWVVAIRHDAVSGQQTWMRGGSREVLDFVRARERDWRWWENPPISRPLVSIVPVKPGDTFEAARPDRGVMLRIRCAWENTGQGVAKVPITEFVKLTLDGAEVVPALVQKKKGPGYADYYHQFHLEAPSPGAHTATVTARNVETRAEIQRTITFTT